MHCRRVLSEASGCLLASTVQSLFLFCPAATADSLLEKLNFLCWGWKVFWRWLFIFFRVLVSCMLWLFLHISIVKFFACKKKKEKKRPDKYRLRVLKIKSPYIREFTKKQELLMVAFKFKHFFLCVIICLLLNFWFWIWHLLTCNTT